MTRFSVNINACVLLFWFLPHSITANEARDNQVASSGNLPAIYIERKIDRSDTLIPQLKIQYELCVTQKRAAQKIYLEDSIIWSAMKESLSSEYVLRIGASPEPEPDWKKEGVGVSIEKEYFYGDKYAHIMYGEKSRISENDGLCRIETYGEYEKQDIDTGEFRYKVSLKNKRSVTNLAAKSIPKKNLYKYTKVRQSKSPVLVRKQSDIQLKKLAEEHPGLFKEMTNRMFSVQRDHSPGVRPGATREVAEVIKEGFKLEETPGTRSSLPRVNDESFVLDQLCDIVESKLTKGKIWYWQKMHQYPTVMERPIILKKEQKIGQKLTIEEAVRFEVRKQFKDEIFEPPPGIKITRAVGLRKPKPSKGSAVAPQPPDIKKQP